MEVLYEIIKNNKIIANMKRRDSILIALNELIEMVDNYNKKLARYISLDSCKDLLGIRFFEKKDMYGAKSDMDYNPEIYPDTRKSIKRKHPVIPLTPEEECYNEDGLIGTTESDITINRDKQIHIITINLDENSIRFENFFYELDFASYEYKRLCKISDLHTCEYDFSNIQFNELEDLNDFLCHNALGWLSDKASKKVILSYDV